MRSNDEHVVAERDRRGNGSIGRDRLAPRQVTLGLKAGSAYEVLSGLEAGDQVVVSGNFLLASESRLKSATGLW